MHVQLRQPGDKHGITGGVTSPHGVEIPTIYRPVSYWRVVHWASSTMGEDRVPSPVQRSFRTNKREIDGWPICFWYRTRTFVLFRSSTTAAPQKEPQVKIQRYTYSCRYVLRGGEHKSPGLIPPHTRCGNINPTPACLWRRARGVQVDPLATTTPWNV